MARSKNAVRAAAAAALVLGLTAALTTIGEGSTVAEERASVVAAITARPAPATAPSTDPVIAAAGDIACNATDEAAAVAYHDTTQCQEAKTAALVEDPSISAVLALGDDQYYDGDAAQFAQMYDQTWGRVLNKTYPVPGNHEYYGPDGTANGYFGYYGARAGTPGQGWYSFDIGAWHLIALNTGACTAIGGCSPAYPGHAASPQYTWLVHDLAQHPNQCILAYWHQPVFSGGAEGGTKALGGLFGALYAAKADVILNGHNHDYERFAQQDNLGFAEPGRGVREFIVGTGGRSHEPFTTLPANTEARFTDSYGVLRMTLHQTSYDWQFVDAAGSTSTDAGSDTCHAVTPTVTAPRSVLRGSPLVLTGTGQAGTPVVLHVSNAKAAWDVTVRPDANGVWTTTRATTPADGTYQLSATSGPQSSATVSTTMTGTTLLGPASVARGGKALLSGLAEPGRRVTVYVSRPATTPLAFTTTAGADGTYRVLVPVGAAASWWAVSNAYRTATGRPVVHGLTVTGPAKAVAHKQLTFTGLAAPGAPVVVFTRSHGGKTAIGHATHANARGVYTVKLALGMSSAWWATSAGVRSPVHATTIAVPPKH